MKRLLYLVCVVVFAAGLSSCNKDSDPEPAPVVGKWKSDIIRRSGLTGDFAVGNVDIDALKVYGLDVNFEVKTDNTFAGTDRSGGVVDPFNGTWTYSGTDLTFKYDAGGEEKLTYDAAKSQLLGEQFTVPDTLINPKTNVATPVTYKLQIIFSKQ
ncbi:hypothetical protein ACFPMF_24210 [Larkinella bovis]|uniref:Lipocalin-like domain-containing protein n=1 Tax=Larkinella bovis TaxID=683041 RepID=A0ABW0IG56_9BACT